MRPLPKSPDDLITASEVAAFAYCAEQWRLEHGLALPAGNDAARQAGKRHHGWKATAERRAGRWIAIARYLVIVAGLVLVLLFLWLVWR